MVGGGEMYRLSWWESILPQTSMPFHLQAKTILQNTRQIWFILMEALSLSTGPTIKSNIVSTCLVTHLFGVQFFYFCICFLFLFCFEESVWFVCFFLFLYQGICPWKPENTEPIMNLSAPQCVLEFLCVVLVNKETHLYTPKQNKTKQKIC